MKIYTLSALRVIFVCSLTIMLTSDSPAMAWGRGGWHGGGGFHGGWGRGGSWGYHGTGWGYRGGWGYGGFAGYAGWGGGYGYGAVLAGAALTGMAIGAIAESQLAPVYGYGYNYGYSPSRLCLVNQPYYDAWGNFISYRQVQTLC